MSLYFGKIPLSGGNSKGSLVFDKEQNLTEEQKAQVRKNIGAISKDEANIDNLTDNSLNLNNESVKITLNTFDNLNNKNGRISLMRKDNDESFTEYTELSLGKLKHIYKDPSTSAVGEIDIKLHPEKIIPTINFEWKNNFKDATKISNVILKGVAMPIEDHDAVNKEYLNKHEYNSITIIDQVTGDKYLLTIADGVLKYSLKIN